ncbi:MAG TPA: hypothetical protein DEF42_17450 [Desulfosporosinus sp.]|nr:hypothetical protein [Desulfosporosinus sp.]
MAELTTGLIENTAVLGVRPTVTFVVRITNDGTTTESVMTEGSFVLGAIIGLGEGCSRQFSGSPSSLTGRT